MAETTSEALREIADMLDGLRDVCVITSRKELATVARRLRELASRERTLSQDTLRLYDEETVGDCDQCGSKLVFRGRNPSVLVCPLGCHEVGP